MKSILSDRRIGAVPGTTEGAPYRSEFEVDVDRITFCDAFRRLQDKTQVHGPAGNDYVRSRLTHSLEVSRVGRHLGCLAGQAIIERRPDLAGPFTAADFGHVVSAACLMHDIGNPPFGHTGERVFSEIFQNNPLGREIAEGLDPTMRAEVTAFEGNAQGLRVVTRLQGWRNEGGLQLTASTIAAACKYPFAADSARAKAKKGKYNFFQSEAEIIAEAAEATGMIPHPEGGWKRHPLAYLVEAADDICYRIVDVEDAYVMRCLTFAEAESLLMGIAGDPGDDYHTIETPTKKLVRLRSRAISRLVAQVAETFSDSIDGVLSGDHPGDLVMQGEAAPALATVESVSRSRIYAGPERLKTDLLAHKVLTTLLHAYLSAFHERETKGKAMSSLAKNTLKSFPYADRVGNDKASYVRAVLDYVSGMTDAYAIDRAQLFASTR